MSDERPRLSGWCSPTDQYHDGCRVPCECPGHVNYEKESE